MWLCGGVVVVIIRTTNKQNNSMSVGSSKCVQYALNLVGTDKPNIVFPQFRIWRENQNHRRKEFHSTNILLLAVISFPTALLSTTEDKQESGTSTIKINVLFPSTLLMDIVSSSTVTVKFVILKNFVASKLLPPANRASHRIASFH